MGNVTSITNLTFLRKLVEFTIVDVEVWRYLIQHDGRLSHFRKHVEEFLSNRYLCWITGLSLAPRFPDFYIYKAKLNFLCKKNLFKIR